MTPESVARRRRALDLALLAALVAAACAFWEWNVLRSGTKLLAITNYDWFFEFYPRHHFTGDALRRGALPLWDPHQIAGLPFLATLQAGVLYPPNALFALLPTATAMSVVGLLHLALAGVFAFGLARALGCGRAAAALAGLTFMLGGSTLFLIYQTNALHSVPWLPAALYGTARLGREGSARWALLLGACLALQFLAGRDYTFVMTVYTVALFAGFQAFWMWRDGEGAARIVRHGAALVGAALFAGGLVCAQLLPTLDLALQSGRALAGLQAKFLEIYGPMPPSLLLANLVHPARGPIRREYFGWLPLLCFLLAFRPWGRDRPAVFASVLALLSLLLVLGSQTPLYAAFRMLPLGATFRLPDRFLVLFALALSLGAARGFERLFAVRGSAAERARALAPRAAVALACGVGLAWALGSGWLEAAVERAVRPWSWFTLYGIPREHFAGLGRALPYFGAGSALLALGAWRAGRRGARAVKVAVLVLTAADLGFALRNPFVHPARDPSPPSAAASCYRKASHIAGALGRHLTLQLPDSVQLRDKDGELFGTYSATHYDPLVTRRHAAYFASLQEGGTPIAPSPWNERSLFMGFLLRYPKPERLRLLDLLGARVVLADDRKVPRSPALAALLSRLEHRESCVVRTAAGYAPIGLYENPDALPRAFLVHRVSHVSRPEAALERMLEPDFDPRREAVVEGDVDLGRGDGDPGASRASVVSYAPDEVVVRARAERPALLVLTDSYDADWRATRNGEPVAVHPTDALFRGLVLPAGESEVVFRYRPRSFRRGVAISVAAALLGVLLWVANPRSGGARPRS